MLAHMMGKRCTPHHKLGGGNFATISARSHLYLVGEQLYNSGAVTAYSEQW